MNINETIRNFIGEQLPSGNNIEWNDDTDFVSSGLLDSLSIVRLLVFIEETFSISLDDVLDLDNFKSVNTIYQVVSQKVSNKQEVG